MGGHGGLNILPQKRWNVYGRENRLKVSRDEAKARKKEAEEQEKFQQAEREYRHKVLLKRAGQDIPEDDIAAATTADSLLDSIFNAKESDNKAEHPEIAEQKREEARRRGNPDTQTSDARFDERFQFAYGVGKVQPWYAKAPGDTSEPVAPAPFMSSRARQLEDQLKQAIASAPPPPSSSSDSSSASSCSSSSDSDSNHKHSRKHRRRHRHHSRVSSHSSDSSSSGDERSRKRHKGTKHERSRSRKSSKSRQKEGRKEREKKLAKLMVKPAKTIQELREERLRREMAEKARSREALRTALFADGPGQPGVYNTSFGHAAALKKSRAGPALR